MVLSNGMVGETGFLQVDNRVSVRLGYKTKKEKRQLRKRLEAELNLVRDLMKKIECNGGSNVGLWGSDGKDDAGKLKRVHSEVGSVSWHEARPVDQSSIVTVPERSHAVSDNVEKEKRNTTKAKQFSHRLDIDTVKDKTLPSEQSKKSKGVGKTNGESEAEFGMGGSSSKAFKSCGLLLDKLMKHKHAWVFNEPVDVKALGLHDYFTIIKHPMDLGTVKSRLNTNWYKSPKEFAEDVRLTFRNAMTYNPKGHDVYIMAEILLKIFEEKWVSIEAEYLPKSRPAANYEGSLTTPTSRKTPPLPQQLPTPAADVTRTLDRSESMTTPVGAMLKNINSTSSGRTGGSKKPKAKDPHKRDMTFAEKQKLSADLQNLPSEKLDNVVQIIRKRNPSVCQNDDEIEVDIDSVDTETLWELDRFVMNYKKNLSKIKRRAELAQGGDGAEVNLPEKNEGPTLSQTPNEKSKSDEKNEPSVPPVQDDKQGGNVAPSNNAKSSSSDSGSSSSESDSDCSSE